MFGYAVYYQKANGQIVERVRTTLPDNRIGEYTSMGWLIKDIKYFYNGKIYNTEKERNKAIKRKYLIPDLNYKIKKMIKNNIWKVCFVAYTSTITALIILKV